MESAERGNSTATGSLWPAPACRSTSAIRSERASSSVNERLPSGAVTAMSPLRAEATVAANRSSTVVKSVGSAMDGPRLSPMASRRRCSSAPTSGRSPMAVPGSPTASARRRAKRSAIRTAVSASNRSRLYSSVPSRQLPSPVADARSVKEKERSNLAPPVSTASSLAWRPGRSRRGGRWLLRVSMTWKMGWRESDRVGRTASTSRSKGSSWWAYAARSVSRTRDSSSVKSGLPPRSVRRASVLTKKPTSGSSASSVRPATGVPMSTSLSPPIRCSRAARAACSTMKVLLAVDFASRATPAMVSSGTRTATVPPRPLGEAGRGRSAVRAVSSGAALSRSSQ
ncbi:hypothetical protein SGRI78S_07334 [Streptomyces griseus subsp. griseus]